RGGAQNLLAARRRTGAALAQSAHCINGSRLPIQCEPGLRCQDLPRVRNPFAFPIADSSISRALATAVWFPSNALGRAKNRPKTVAQRLIHVTHARFYAKVLEARYAKMCGLYAARNDAREMGKVRRDIERHAVEGDPAPHPDADRRNLIL